MTLTDKQSIELELAMMEMEREKGITPYRNKIDLLNLINKGWEVFYSTLFGEAYQETFGQGFVEALADHHREALEWHWMSRLALIKDEVQPEHDAYFPIWSRGHMKSYIAERMIVTDALLSCAYKKPGFCHYINREKTKCQEHIGNIETLLSSEEVKRFAPELSQVKRNSETNQQRKWASDYLHTAADYVIKGGSTDSAQAGSRKEDTRITFRVLDDIDGREDSIAIAENRFHKLTGEILPMGQSDTLTFWAQNLISRHSVMNRVYKQQAKVLTGRKPTNPIPAVLDLETKQITVDGIIRDVYESGESTWKQVWDVSRINKEIGQMGLPAFKRECQHEVDESIEGLILYNYDDAVHTVSYSQFTSVYGREDAWKDWYKVLFSDYARTKTKFHANVAGYMSVSSHNTALPGHTFLLPISFEANTPPEDMATRFLNELTPSAYKTQSGKLVTWSELVADAWKRLKPDQHFENVFDRLDYLATYYARVIPRYAQPVLQKYFVKNAVMSHSEDKVRASFNIGFGFNFKPANPTKNAALEDINGAMKVDYNESHCFNVEKSGYTRFHVLCPDDKTVPPIKINGVETYPPVPYPDTFDADGLKDSDLFRFQMRNCRNMEPKITETGERIDEPLKLYDDFKQGLQMVYFKNLLENIKLTTDEKINLLIPEPVQVAMKEKVKEDPVSTKLTYEFHEQQALRELFPEEDELLDWE